jgi:predicted GNAT family acetyltransferase
MGRPQGEPSGAPPDASCASYPARLRTRIGAPSRRSDLAFGPSPREHDEEIILTEGHPNEAVEERAEVRDNPFEGRYEIRVGGRTAGFTAYKSKPNLIAFLYTEIDPSLEGRGLGSRLVSSALEDARERGLEVLPFCPFVNDFISRHRDDYVGLVPERYRQGFGL